MYDYLPLIDEHNKQWQNVLHLEKKWPTKNCWFRLLVTLVGMSVVDLYRIYLNWDKQMYQHLSVVEFSDLLCMNLQERKERKADCIAVAAVLHQQQSRGNQMQIECITDSEGNKK